MKPIKSSSAKNNPIILELKNIIKTYKSGDTSFNALDSVCLKIKSGEFVSITGPSGSGKSTLMHIIGLLDNPSSGQVLLEGQDVSRLKEHQLAKLRNITLPKLQLSKMLPCLFFTLMSPKTSTIFWLKNCLPKLVFPTNSAILRPSFPVANSSVSPLPGL